MGRSEGAERGLCRSPHNPGLLYAILVAVGFVVGLIAGRWWALAAPAAFGVWIAAASDVDEVPPWFLGAGCALIGAAGVAGGVLLRRFANAS